MSYKQDNLSPQQKKNAYIGISILSLLILSFFIYSFFLKNERKVFLSKNTAITTCKIIRTNTHKATTNTVEYKVSNKRYTYEGLSSSFFQLGEFFNLKYSISNPSISKVIYTEPIIKEYNNYEEKDGKILSIYSNEKVNVIKFQYDYNGKIYKRGLHIKDISLFKENQKYKILIKKNNPKISYLKSIIKVSY